MRKRSWIALAGLLLATATVSGCGGGGSSNSAAVGKVAIGVSPRSATVAEGQQVSFNANLVNATNTSVTWTVQETNGGTITSAGVYTAPNATGVFHVVATSQQDPGATATAVVTVGQPIALVSPANGLATTYVNLTIQITATTVDTPVTWTVREGATGGTVSQTGLYTAPATPGTYHVDITSNANANIKQTVTITVLASPLSVTPTSATINVGATLVLTATFTGITTPQLIWTVAESGGGTVVASANTLTATYTAPAIPGTYHVTASGTSGIGIPVSFTVPITVLAGSVTAVIQ